MEVHLCLVLLLVVCLTSTGKCFDNTTKCADMITIMEETEDKIITRNCTYRKLTEIPHTITWPESMKVLNLKGNIIGHVAKLIVEKTDLTILVLSQNVIEYVQDKAFEDLDSLEQLYLDSNKIRRMHIDTFKGLELLKVLDLSSNALLSLPDAIFDKMFGLMELRLSSNPLKVLNPSLLQNLNSLNILEVKKIGCKNLEDDVFHKLESLNSVDLSWNKFEKVPTHQLVQVRDDNVYGLRYLTMDGNPIKELNSDSFKDLSTLKSVHFSHMPDLEIIKKFTFSSLKNLQTVKISSNPKLKTIESGAFDGLFSADATDNNIVDVHFNDNNLDHIPADLLPWKELQTIDLQGNRWHCDCQLNWFNGLKMVINPSKLKNNWRCIGPSYLAGRAIDDLVAADYVCKENSNPLSLTEQNKKHTSTKAMALIWGLTTTFVGLICLTIIAYIYKKRSSYKNSKVIRNGVIRYRKAHTQPEEMDPVDL